MIIKQHFHNNLYYFTYQKLGQIWAKGSHFFALTLLHNIEGCWSTCKCLFQRVIDAMTVGAVLHINNITAIDTTREAIKNYFTDFAPVAWVDFDTGDSKVWQSTCWIRVNLYFVLWLSRNISRLSPEHLD